MSGVVLALVQGQGKADLATGYELDIIASAVVGGASLAGGRGSVIGAVLGTLIFGVLRNALPQIPGATFYDRLIVGLVVIVIVVMDQLLLKQGRRKLQKADSCDLQSGCERCPGGRRWRVWMRGLRRTSAAVARREPRRGSCGSPSFPKALDIPVFNYAKIGAERKAKELGNVDILWRAPDDRRSAEAEGDPRVVHHAAASTASRSRRSTATS